MEPAKLSWTAKKRILGEMATRRRNAKGQFVKSGRSSSTRKRSTTSTRSKTTRRRRRRRNPAEAKVMNVPVKSSVEQGIAFAGGLFASTAFARKINTWLLSKVPGRLQVLGLYGIGLATAMAGIRINQKSRRYPISMFGWGLSAPFFVEGTSALIGAVSSVPAPATTTTETTTTETTTSGSLLPGDTMRGSLLPGDTMRGSLVRTRSRFGNPMYGMASTM